MGRIAATGRRRELIMEKVEINTAAKHVLEHVESLKETQPYTAILLESLLAERSAAWDALMAYWDIKEFLVAGGDLGGHQKAWSLSSPIRFRIRSEEVLETQGKDYHV
jgi:hypothetical protein